MTGGKAHPLLDVTTASLLNIRCEIWVAGADERKSVRATALDLALQLTKFPVHSVI